MLKVVNQKLDELIQELTHCKVDTKLDMAEKLADVHQDLDSFKKKVCSVQTWIKQGLDFYRGVEDKKEEDDGSFHQQAGEGR